MSSDYNENDENQRPGKEWIPDDALESMIMERSLHSGENNVKTSRRLIDENIPIVTQAMLHLAIHSASERIRFDASRYLMDRSLGRASEESVAPESTPVSEFLESVLQDIDQV